MFTKKRHWYPSYTRSDQIHLPRLQWNATGPILVPHLSRSSFHVYKETPLVPFLYQINPDSLSMFKKKRLWYPSCTRSIQTQLPRLQWKATDPIPVPHQSRCIFRVTKKRHWSHSCTKSIQMHLPCWQRNATGPIPVPHLSRSNFRVYKETPLVPITHHTKQARIFNPAFFRYIRILIELLRPSLPRVFPVRFPP